MGSKSLERLNDFLKMPLEDRKAVFCEFRAQEPSLIPIILSFPLQRKEKPILSSHQHLNEENPAVGLLGEHRSDVLEGEAR